MWVISWLVVSCCHETGPKPFLFVKVHVLKNDKLVLFFLVFIEDFKQCKFWKYHLKHMYSQKRKFKKGKRLYQHICRRKSGKIIVKTFSFWGIFLWCLLNLKNMSKNRKSKLPMKEFYLDSYRISGEIFFNL